MTKANGRKQLYSREKIVKTCLRMGASRETADEVARKVDAKVHEGIETRKILQLILRYLSKYKPSVRFQTCLRRGLSLMRPKPDFEHFIQILLSEHGYEVVPNQVVRGKCVEHEIDAVARRDSVTYIVEVKHHYNYHTPTGLDESRIARAVFEDVTEGFEHGLNNLKIDKAMIVCNTKFSRHAERYAECRGIRMIGWSSPSGNGLQDMIEEKKLYPITCLKGLNAGMREKLASAEVLLIKQLTTRKLEEIVDETRIPEGTLKQIVKRAKTVLEVA